MAPPPAKKAEESNTISMVVAKWKTGQNEQFSPVQRVSGFPWRLMVKKSLLSSGREAFLLCDKSKEAEVWRCTANISASFIPSPITKIFDGLYDDDCCKKYEIGKGDFPEGTRVEVEITTEDDGDKSCRNYPILDVSDARDGILVAGGKKVYVNKKSLSSQSPFFHRLFYGDLKEKKMDEIPIGDVEYEELRNVIRLVYRSSDASLTDENVNRMLELGDRFEIKIIEDRVSNFLFTSSTLPLVKKLLIADKYRMEGLKTTLVCGGIYTEEELKELEDAPELKDLLPETTQDVFKWLLTSSK